MVANFSKSQYKITSGMHFALHSRRSAAPQWGPHLASRGDGRRRKRDMMHICCTPCHIESTLITLCRHSSPCVFTSSVMSSPRLHTLGGISTLDVASRTLYLIMANPPTATDKFEPYTSRVVATHMLAGGKPVIVTQRADGTLVTNTASPETPQVCSIHTGIHKRPC